MNRRQFLRQIVRILTTSITAFIALKFFSLRMLQRPAPLRLASAGSPPVLRPPGALPEAEFLSRCIRCQRCQDACQPGAIRLAGPNDNVQLGTPFIVPTETACALSLNCTTACPTGALQPIQDIAKVRMGTAVVDKRTCVSHNGTGVCGACHTACPFKNRAITQGARNAPTVHPEHCVGCGLCEEACPVKETKAIRVFSERRFA